ncbi:MAG: hypothetical protein LUG95_02890 [Clostridiales bacterium]|nr:hypothetical protein [Clostridiales bacterium]
MIKNLDGNWLFKASDSSELKKAEVPGCNVFDLMNNGDIDDPLLYDNEKRFSTFLIRIGNIDASLILHPTSLKVTVYF